MRTLLAQRRMRLYYLGTTLSTIGDYALWIAAGVWVKELTGSIAQAGLCMLALIAGTLLAPVTGYLVDRMRRKPLLMATDALCGLLVLTLTLVHDARQVWLIYAVMFACGVASSLTGSAMNALLPTMVEPEQLGTANGLAQTLTQGQRLLTPALGLGLLAAFGGGVVAVLDTVSFAAGLACWAFIKVDEPKPTPKADREGWRAETTAGFRFLRKDRALRQLTLALTLGLFVMGLFETLALAVTTVGLHRSPSWVGVLITTVGVSGIVGGLLVGKMMQRLGAGWLTALGLACSGAGALAMAAPVVAVVIGAALLLGFGLPCVIVGAMTAVQLGTPNELLGRVMGANNFLITLGQAIGIASGSALISALPYRDIAYGAAALLALSALYLATRKEHRPAAAATAEPTEAPVAEPQAATEPQPV